MAEPNVSIIVPIYKVEPYLRKCLDSIVSQTHQNLEIILVDDGSPDNCGKICDEYAAADQRIKVIHKPNGGVSSARNAGLDAVTDGEWIMWVDPDDWIEPDMVEYLLKKAEEYGVEIAECGFYMEYANGQVPCGYLREEIQEGIPLIENLIKERISNAQWCKLWRRELYCGERFPENRMACEDVAITYSILKKVQKILCLPEAKYHFLQRAGSITHTNTLKQLLDAQQIQRDCFEDTQKTWSEIDISYVRCIVCSIGVWLNYYTCPRDERALYWPQIKELSAFAKAHPNDCRAARQQLGITGRAVLPLLPYATWWSFALAGFWGWLYRLKRRRMGANTVISLPGK